MLGEFARRVVAFEREPALVELAARLQPDIEFSRVDSLGELPAQDASFDFVLTFAVLQHLAEDAVAGVTREIRRLVRRPGFVLLCEETDPDHRWADPACPHIRFTIGRSVEAYQRLMAPFELIETSPRLVEPTYPRPHVGSYMLFKSGQRLPPPVHRSPAAGATDRQTVPSTPSSRYGCDGWPSK